MNQTNMHFISDAMTFFDDKWLTIIFNNLLVLFCQVSVVLNYIVRYILFMTKSLDQCLFSVLETMLKTMFETKLETKLETMFNSSSCRFSTVFGRQTLPTGEEAFCDNGWTVNSFLNLYLPI